MSGARAVARCDALREAPFSTTGSGLYRAYLTPEYVEAQRQVGQWMNEAGMETRIDCAGNLVGLYPRSEARAAPLIIGSHLDTVKDGGAYDGALGIMLGIECVAALKAAGCSLPFPIEIYAFGDEEGSRFPNAMLTSRAVAGTLDRNMIDVADAEGRGLAEALSDCGLDADAYLEAAHPGALAYLEAHIEQGPLLEAEGLAVGSVTSIAAQLRYQVEVRGVAGHAGTNIMALRRDALAGAAAMMVAIEDLARRGPESLVATVGKLEVSPGAANVVPGRVVFTLDIRAGDNATRDRAAEEIMARIARIAEERRLSADTRMLHDLSASPCDPRLTDLLDQAIAAAGQACRRLVSGAGHDAMVMAALCPTAMLFIRCREGITHNPAEHIEAADAEIALRVMEQFVLALAEQQKG